MKSLQESLFDKDLYKQGAHIGDLYELDKWFIPARGDEYEFTNDILEWGIKPECGVVLGKSHWRKILKPINSFPEVSLKKCYNYRFLKYITEIILCCELVKQIPEVVKDYIMDCRNNPDKFIKRPKDYEFVKEHIFQDVEVQALDMPRWDMDLRMVVIKFLMENGDDHIICVTFKKREL